MGMESLSRIVLWAGLQGVPNCHAMPLVGIRVVGSLGLALLVSWPNP